MLAIVYRCGRSGFDVSKKTTLALRLGWLFLLQQSGGIRIPIVKTLAHQLIQETALSKLAQIRIDSW